MGLPLCLGWVLPRLVSFVGVRDDFSYGNGTVSFGEASSRSLSLVHRCLGLLTALQDNYIVADAYSLFKTFY